MMVPLPLAAIHREGVSDFLRVASILDLAPADVGDPNALAVRCFSATSAHGRTFRLNMNQLLL